MADKRDGKHGLQDDGEERTVGRDETVQALGGEHHPLLVVDVYKRQVDCKKIFTVNRLDNKEGRSFFREVFIRRGSTSGVYGVEAVSYTHLALASASAPQL